MNLVDVIDPKYGLQQDEWSLSKPIFGKHGQMEIIGWGSRNSSGIKVYIVNCRACAQDSELFGEGMFKAAKANFLKGSIPCGCSAVHQWSEDQYKVRCTRKASELGYEFLGWAESFRGVLTKIKMSCLKHGTWETGCIDTLTGMSKGCGGCKVDTLRLLNTKPDDEMVKSFLISGQFAEGTKFWRSERLSNAGFATYWYVSCPECGAVGESTRGNIQKGHRPCLCSNSRQQECYINWIIGKGGIAVALKFGIANTTERRVQAQNNRSVYEVRNYAVYKFLDKLSCVTAERECLQTLECGLLTQEEMPDGYTETTDVLNLVRIKQIYEKHGGVRSET